jgi:signal recognition particle receptor subunit beta
MSAKIVYYGPGLCGKTTSLKYVFHHTRADARGKMVSLATETDRTLFFDLLPLEVGTVAGFHTRIQLYTVPGQVFYNSTRRLVLKGVDGIVFVADSQPAMLPSNVESFRNMEVNLAELGIETNEIPLVLQYNKRDLPEVCSVAELREALNSNDWPEFETSAIVGTGIFEVLREISKLTLISLKKQLEDGVPETLTPPIAPRRPMAPKLVTAEPPEIPQASAEDSKPATDEQETEDEAPDHAAGEKAPELLVDAVPEPLLDAVPEPEAPEEAAPAEEDRDASSVEASEEETVVEEPQSHDTILVAESPEESEGDEIEPSETSDAAAIAETNGRRRIDHALNLALPGSDLERARRVSLDLQVRDERNRVLHQVRDIEWSLQDADSLQDVLLHLKIELEREDA